MEIKIIDVIGTRCIIKEDGKKVFELIYPKIHSGEKVTLDFDGVTQFASPFFNLAIGSMLKDKDITESSLRSRLFFINLNKTGEMVAERVIENAVKYHGDRDYRKIVDDILEQQAKEAD
jgi:hypothetical protein